MNKFQLLLVLILFSFTSMFSLKASSTLKNQAFLELQLSVLNHELCPSNGTIEFLAVSDDTSPITYSIYSSSDLINPIAITNQNELSGLIADSYTVIASQITDGETFTMSESIVVLNQLVVFDYSISVTNEYCNGDGSIAVNILSGSAVSYEITDGPEIRPIQTTSNFINLPAGIFTLEIINSCEEVCISQVTVQYFGNDISISNVVNNLTACDEIGVTIYIIRLDNANVIYPLEYTYIVHPPLTSGLPDDTLSYTMSTGGNPITTGHIQHAIPFYGANNIYTYDLTVMDGCGELFISPTATVNKALFYIMTPQYENCLDHFKMSFLQFQGPLYLELLEAPPGFDPSEYNDIYPGPYPDANYGHFNPVIFKNDTESAPPGLYKFKLTDACGTEFIGSKTLQPFGLKPYNPL